MPLVYGVANNDANYQVRVCDWVEGKTVQKWICPYYKTWIQMLTRCYSESHKSTYKYKYESLVCEEWLTFSNFKSWMEKQDWEGKQLDKDILGAGCKIYLPSTCCFVSQEINKYFNLHKNKNRDLPVGVSHQHKGRGKPYVARIHINGKAKHLGQYDCVETAHFTWLQEKILDFEKHLYQNDLQLICSLVKIKLRMQHHLENKQILKSYWEGEL